jgi:hypothetical protein
LPVHLVRMIRNLAFNLTPLPRRCCSILNRVLALSVYTTLSVTTLTRAKCTQKTTCAGQGVYRKPKLLSFGPFNRSVSIATRYRGHRLDPSVFSAARCSPVSALLDEQELGRGGGFKPLPQAPSIFGQRPGSLSGLDRDGYTRLCVSNKAANLFSNFVSSTVPMEWGNRTRLTYARVCGWG